VTEGIDDGHQIAWPGARVTSRDEVPGAGTWEVVDHGECACNGTLRAFARGATAPRCPCCGAMVTWQLTHLAPSVAADHKDVGPLP
jgi:hypothetical protein